MSKIEFGFICLLNIFLPYVEAPVHADYRTYSFFKFGSVVLEIQDFFACIPAPRPVSHYPQPSPLPPPPTQPAGNLFFMYL